MPLNKKLIIAVGLTTVFLSGCSTAMFSGNPTGEITLISGNTYQYRVVHDWDTTYIRFRDHMNETAQEFCQKTNHSAQLLDAVSQEKGKGMQGMIIFRCVGILPPPPGTGLFNKEIQD